MQYEDESGTPYYYDPKNNITQYRFVSCVTASLQFPQLSNALCVMFAYRLPVDAPIRHYTEDERQEYDAQYGEGAYDAWKADMAWKVGGACCTCVVMLCSVVFRW